LSKLFGGFQFSGVLSRTSGAPFYVTQGSANNLNAPGSGQAPDQIKSTVQLFGGNLKGAPPTGADPTAYQFFDRSALRLPWGKDRGSGEADCVSLFNSGSIRPHNIRVLAAEALENQRDAQPLLSGFSGSSFRNERAAQFRLRVSF
jgi:hypothetical protein